VQKLSHSFSGALRTFSFWVANGTLGYQILNGVDYRSVLLSEPSALEQVYAIFANVIELDDAGFVVNAKYAERRAAQWLRATSTAPTKCSLHLKLGRRNFIPLRQELIREHLVERAARTALLGSG
jgi:hypothetical protein